MSSKTIKKSVNINAGSETVWDVLTNDRLTRIWYAAFSEGAHAETDWKEGSKAIFKDNAGFGLVGRVIKSMPNEVLSVEYTGVLTDGKEDYDSDLAKQVKGGREMYSITHKEGITRLDIASDMSEDSYDQMSQMWDKALVKIKQLAENSSEVE